MKTSRIVFSIVVLLLSMACGSKEDPRFTEFKEAIQSSVGLTISLAEHTTFDWERVYFYGPYTPYSIIRNETGFDPPVDLEQEYVEGSNPFVSETSCVVVFADGSDLVGGFLHPRSDFDSSRLSTKSFSKAHSVFFVAPCEDPGGPRLELPGGQ